MLQAFLMLKTAPNNLQFANSNCGLIPSNSFGMRSTRLFPLGQTTITQMVRSSLQEQAMADSDLQTVITLWTCISRARRVGRGVARTYTIVRNPPIPAVSRILALTPECPAMCVFCGGPLSIVVVGKYG
ncbi:hypothetical protein CDAR_41271 [Caerostris darwini]|uniref:Uncharacterized protein n=1 Tax=Caerostris darwini TaxID=1538125 RepID=A0AAV4SQJ8_9ARAC|nr:hypothetical protein CDAR_41271 [Caerostris darwini]